MKETAGQEKGGNPEEEKRNAVAAVVARTYACCTTLPKHCCFVAQGDSARDHRSQRALFWAFSCARGDVTPRGGQHMPNFNSISTSILLLFFGSFLKSRSKNHDDDTAVLGAGPLLVVERQCPDLSSRLP